MSMNAYTAIRKGTGYTFGFIGTWEEVSKLDNRLWDIGDLPKAVRYFWMWDLLPNGMCVKVA